MKPAIFLFPVMLLCCRFPLAADLEWIDIEIWCELEPLVIPEEDDFPLPMPVALDRLLEEARIIFSYMIYGGRFTYTPSDLGRQVDEEYTVQPLHEIQWGDRNLTVRESRVDKGRLYAIIRYTLLDFQADRIRSWSSNVFPSVKSRGQSEYYLGYTARITALENAVKNGVHAYLRSQIFNKPRRINGDFLLLETPFTIIKAGQFITDARLKLHIKDVTAYKNF